MFAGLGIPSGTNRVKMGTLASSYTVILKWIKLKKLNLILFNEIFREGYLTHHDKKQFLFSTPKKSTLSKIIIRLKFFIYGKINIYKFQVFIIFSLQASMVWQMDRQTDRYIVHCIDTNRNRFTFERNHINSLHVDVWHQRHLKPELKN